MPPRLPSAYPLISSETMSAPATTPSELARSSTRRRALGRISALLVALFAGIVFAAGLILSGMTQPEKVIAFLDIKEMFVGPFPGQWDPALLFVVVGALAVALLGFALTPYASVRPWFMASFSLSGYSPATALASLLTGQIDTVMFVLAMLPGMWVAGKF